MNTEVKPRPETELLSYALACAEAQARPGQTEPAPEDVASAVALAYLEEIANGTEIRFWKAWISKRVGWEMSDQSRRFYARGPVESGYQRGVPMVERTLSGEEGFERAKGRDAVDALREVLPNLKWRTRVLLDLIYREGFSAREAGARLNMSEAAVNKEKARALAKLSEAFRRNGIDESMLWIDLGMLMTVALVEDQRRANSGIAQLLAEKTAAVWGSVKDLAIRLWPGAQASETAGGAAAGTTAGGAVAAVGGKLVAVGCVSAVCVGSFTGGIALLKQSPEKKKPATVVERTNTDSGSNSPGFGVGETAEASPGVTPSQKGKPDSAAIQDEPAGSVTSDTSQPDRSLRPRMATQEEAQNVIDPFAHAGTPVGGSSAPSSAPVPSSSAPAPAPSEGGGSGRAVSEVISPIP